MSLRWPEDVEPEEIPSLSQWVRNGHDLDGELPGYPGGKAAFDQYFEAYADPMYGWQARRKWRVQIIWLEYGGKAITDKTVKERFYRALRDYDSIQITNDNLGGDPLPNIRKEFLIRYRNINNEDNRCLKQRRLLEGETLDFSWDITKAKYGDHPDIWSLDRFPIAMQNLFWLLDHNESVQLSADVLGCDPALNRDKYLYLWYGSSKRGSYPANASDGMRLRFSSRWG